MINKNDKFLILTHYRKDDKKFYGDYYDIELFLNDKKIMEFGDEYHDKGDIKVESFIDGYCFAIKKKIDILRKDIADREE